MAEELGIGYWVQISDLGRGSFGVVSLWKNKKTDEFIAVKRCKLNKVSQRQDRRWRNEVQIMQTLSHENLVKYKPLPNDFPKLSNPSALPLLSMEYCSAGNLRQVLRSPENACGLGEEQAKEVLIDVASGLHYLHDHNITHRDLKPDNVVLQKCKARKSGLVYKLIDLGFAKELQNTLSLVGTYEYVAPEILEDKHYSHSVDYWSLGIMTYEVICCTYPFMKQSNLVDKIKLLQSKRSDHICIYVDSETKSLKYSSKIRHHCRISSCLKSHMERWLQIVLEYNHEKRGINVEQNVLLMLTGLLRKKIVTLFSVYTFEFYYYEINEYTVISTLKDWICRDTKVHARELMLLFPGRLTDYDDNDLVINVWNESCPEIYAFKTGADLNRKSKTITPMFLKKVTPGYFLRQEELRAISNDAFFYVVTEKRYITALHGACTLFKQYAKSLCDKITLLSHAIESHFLRLVSDVTKNRLVPNYKTQLGAASKILDRLLVFPKRCQIMKTCKELLDQHSQSIEEIFSECGGRSLSEEANKIFVHPNENDRDRSKKLVEIAIHYVKLREKILCIFKSFCICGNYITKEFVKLSAWFNEIEHYMNSIMNNAFEQKQISSAASCPNKLLEDGTSCYTRSKIRNKCDKSVEDIINQNETARIGLEESINSCLASYKHLCNDLQISTIKKVQKSEAVKEEDLSL